MIPDLSKKIKVVFFDIDDTLYMKDKDYLPPTTINIISKLKSKGIIPAIATGRSLCSLPVKLESILNKEKIDLLVTMNGQYVTYKNKQIAAHPIDKLKIENLIYLFKQNKIEYAFVSPEQISVSKVTKKLKEALDPITHNYVVDPDYFKNNPVYQLLAFYNESQDKLIESSEYIKGLKTVRWHKYSVDIFDQLGSKARGIKSVINHLNIKLEEVMAFGDGLNDIEMLTTVGIGVAMGNAHSELKLVADYITDHLEEEGILNFLIKSNLIEK